MHPLLTSINLYKCRSLICQNSPTHHWIQTKKERWTFKVEKEPTQLELQRSQFNLYNVLCGTEMKLLNKIGAKLQGYCENFGTKFQIIPNTEDKNVTAG